MIKLKIINLKLKTYFLLHENVHKPDKFQLLCLLRNNLQALSQVNKNILHNTILYTYIAQIIEILLASFRRKRNKMFHIPKTHVIS